MTEKELLIETIWKIAKAFKAQQHESEFKSLISLLIDHKKKYGIDRIIEIGSFDGGTTQAFLRLSEMVVSVDRKHKSIIPEALQIQGDSQSNEVFSKVIDHIHPREADLLFIDGDHSAVGCMRDFEIYSQFVKSGGLVVFHDINDNNEHSRQGCFVSKTWNHLKNIYKYVEFINDKNSWGGIGVLWMP